MSNVRTTATHRRTDSDGCSCQSTGSEESCSLTDDYPSDTTTSSTRSSSLQGGGRGAPHTVLSGWNFYSSHHPPHHRHRSQERAGTHCKANGHKRASSGASTKRMDSGYNGGTGSVHDGVASRSESLNGPQEPFFLHEPNMTSDDRVKKLFDSKSKKNKEEDVHSLDNGTATTNGAKIVTVEVHHSSASEDSNSVSDVSDPLPDYDDQGSQSSSTGNHCGTTGHRIKKTSREASSLSTDEGIYHDDDEQEEEDDLEDNVRHLVPHEDEEDDEDELHDNEVSFSPHHQEDLVAIRNKRPPPEEDTCHPASLRASRPADAAPHEDTRSGTLSSKRNTLTRQSKKEQPVFQPPPPPPPPSKKAEETKPVFRPPSPPPLPVNDHAKVEEAGGVTKAPPPPPPPDLPLKTPPKKAEDKAQRDDDATSQRSEDSSNDGEGRRYVKNTASRKNSQQRTLPFIPPQFGFPPDTNENIRPSEYLRQAKGGSKHSTLKSNSTLHRAVSMGELAMASKPEKISFGSRTESHETLLESDPRSPFNKQAESKPHTPLSNSSSNGSTPSFSITVEQLQTVHLKKTDKPNTPERTVLLQKNDLIEELKQTKDIQGVRKMKQERSRIEEIMTADMAQAFKAENFVDQIPETDANGCVIPPWKRQMLAKKAAEKAKKEAEEQRLRDAEAKKLNSIPPWKRQLLQRKEPTSPITAQSVHRTLSTPVPKNSLELPPAPAEQQTKIPVPEQNGVKPSFEATDPQNGDADDIPPNPWLQQLRKTKSVYR